MNPKTTTATLAATLLLLAGATSAAATGRGHDPVTICHKGQTITVDDDAVQKHLDNHGDYVGSCTEPEAFVPFGASARWLLPASWDYATTPTYQAAIFPQTVLGGPVPACRWSQDDDYWMETPEEATLFESLDDDGVLTQGEDSAIYAGHVFTAGPTCVVEEPPTEEPPVEEPPTDEPPVVVPPVVTPPVVAPEPPVVAPAAPEVAVDVVDVPEGVGSPEWIAANPSARVELG